MSDVYVADKYPEAPGLLQQRLIQHLQHIAIPRDPDWSPLGHRQVQTYLMEQFSQWGSVAPFAVQSGQQTFHNLVVKIAGSHRSNPILVGAHFDAVPASPGADDNASGVAVLLELAHYFHHHPPRCPVYLVAFDREERGLLGSMAYAAYLHNHHQKIRLMLSLEMVGYRDPSPRSQRYPHPLLKRIYPSQGDFTALVGNPTSLLDMIHLSRHLHRQGIPSRWLPVPNRGLALPDTRRSDHAPFWDHGHNAIMVTDTANLRNPHYHRLTDTVDTLDLAFLTGICGGLADGIGSLG
ncbi:MAG: M28 family peptidase [Synechococcaceae cyanobacterium SM2_3_2]|nr:M28 family peptidase [Synechococcaceae cyanobacterium SM2_3_2]